MKNVVGLFGTCGNSSWREDQVIPALKEANVDYFNPVVSDWNEEAMKNEAEHAATDKVIMLVITGETTGIASMAESGWIANLCHLRGQSLVIFLEDMPEEPQDGSLRINKTRKLLRNYIEQLKGAGHVHSFENLQEATDKVISLMQAPVAS